jgi:hypothetical protein
MGASQRGPELQNMKAKESMLLWDLLQAMPSENREDLVPPIVNSKVCRLAAVL